MEIAKLVVDQNIWLDCGDRFKEVVVEEITENYVRVLIPRTERENGYEMDFRYDGSQICTWGWIDAWDPRPACGPNHVPWKLVVKRAWLRRWLRYPVKRLLAALGAL